MSEKVTNLSEYRAGMSPIQKPPLKGGGGDGTFDGMEARVSRLEEDWKEIKADLKAIRSDLSEIKGRTSALPDARAFGMLEGRVNSLPTLASLATLLGIGVALLTAAIHLRTILGWFNISF